MASPTTIINFKGFKQFFKDIIGSYLIQHDTYKDENDEGIFERYMALFGESLDEEQARHIDDYLKIIDASLCDEKYLIHISDVLGNPPDIFKSVEQYRNLLSYITNVYKVKGTVKGYKLFFYILGFDVEITNLEPTSNVLQYDTGKRYDDGHKYDEEGCQSCSFYTINIKRIDGSQYLLDANTIELFKNAIEFNEPINAKLSKFLVTVTLEDELNIIDLSEELTSIEQAITPINCVLSDWGPWGPCRPDSTQVRTRTILTQPYAGGTPCGPLEETRSCQLPVDCELSEWSEWSECIDESQTRTKTIITQPKGTGAPCGPTSETRACTPEVPEEPGGPATGTCYNMTLNSENYFGRPNNLKIRSQAPGSNVSVKPLDGTMLIDNLDGTYTYYICSEVPVTFKQDGYDVIWPGGSFTSTGSSCYNDSACIPLQP